MWTPGLWYMLSLRPDGSTPDWPPEDDAGWALTSETPGKESFMFYNDDVGIDGTVDFLDQGLAVYYTDDFGGAQLQSFERISPDGSRHYSAATLWYHYDLTGMDAASIVRAEFVVNVYPDQDIDNPSLVIRTRNTLTEFEGFRPSWEDFVTDPGPTHGPPGLTLERLSDITSSYPHEFSDPYLHPNWAGFENRCVFPLSEAAVNDLRRGGRQGIYCALVNPGNSAPTGDWNRLLFDATYDFWDSGIAAGQPAHEAGATLPHLRLWPGGGEAELTLGLRIEARPRIEVIRRVLSHEARKRRDFG